MIHTINTYKRPTKQITLSNLPQSIKDKTWLVVQHSERDLYHKIHDKLVVLPPWITNLTDTRQWMIEEFSGEPLLVMDDDLRFNVRRDGKHDKLYKPTEEEVCEMFHTIERMVSEEVPFVGVSRREGNNRQPSDLVCNTRIAQMWAVHTPTIKQLGYRFDRTRTKEDMDMILQILDGGRRNLCLYKWAVEGGNSNSEGGCSSYRTHELMKEDAEKFASLWPGIVKVVEKETKSSWGGGVRHDVRVQWKKAYRPENLRRGS